MSNEPESDKTLTDEQLDAMLRDVSVPTNLQDELLAIPNSQTEEKVGVAGRVDSSGSQWPLSSLVALAATLLAVGAFFAWPWITGEGTGHGPELAQNPPASKTNDRSGEPATPKQANPDTAPEEMLAQTPDATEAIEIALHEIEMRQLRKRLVGLKREAAPAMEAREYHSLITAIADQTILQLGGSEETVRQDMAQVIKQYPNTVGATIAQDFLDSRTQ